MRDLPGTRFGSVASLFVLALGLCSCDGDVAPEGPPPAASIPSKPYRVAVLRLGREAELAEIPVSALKAGMKSFQFTEGPYYTLDVVDLKGDLDSVPEKLEQAIRQGADVIAVTHPNVLRAATAREVRKPLVFAILGDPSALEGSPSQLRGMTGVYNPLPTSAVLDLVKYYVPRTRRVGVVFNRRDPLSVAHKDALIRDSASAAVEVVAVEFDGEETLPAATDALWGQSIDVVCLVAGLGSSSAKVIEKARQAKTPVFGFLEDHVRAGALAAQVQEADWVGIEAGKMICPILGGQKPQDLALKRLVDTVTVVNPATAGTLGITLPPGALRSARVVGD